MAAPSARFEFRAFAHDFGELPALIRGRAAAMGETGSEEEYLVAREPGIHKLERPEYDLPRLLEELIRPTRPRPWRRGSSGAPASRWTTASSRKSTCAGERRCAPVGGRGVRDPESVLAVLDGVGLAGYENLSYPGALRRVLGMERLPPWEPWS